MLASTTSATLLAGCNWSARRTKTRTRTASTEDTSPRPGKRESDLRILESEFAPTGESRTERGILRVLAANAGDVRLSYAEVVPEFFDADGDLLDIEQAEVLDLDPGETWEAFIPYRGDPALVSDYRIVGSFVAGDTVEPIDDVTLITTDLKTSPVEVLVVGQARNDRIDPVGYLEIRAKFYDGDGALVYSDFVGTTDLSPDETWTFEVEFRSDVHGAGSDVNEYAVEVSRHWW